MKIALSDHSMGARSRHWSVLAATGFALLAIAAWDLAGGDLPLAALSGTARGFPWREQWLLTDVLHSGGRHLSWACALALCLTVWWPVGPLKRLDRSARLQLAVTTLLACVAVTVIKAVSVTSCPWDLQAFGGVAHYVPHWGSWGQVDGGSGHCFPAGHASSGFAFVGGWFVFRPWPKIATRWLVGALAAGLLFGIAQQLRGAHFMSHTLWTGWICWVVAWMVDAAWPTLGEAVLQ